MVIFHSYVSLPEGTIGVTITTITLTFIVIHTVIMILFILLILIHTPKNVNHGLTNPQFMDFRGPKNRDK